MWAMHSDHIRTQLLPPSPLTLPNKDPSPPTLLLLYFCLFSDPLSLARAACVRMGVERSIGVWMAYQ